MQELQQLRTQNDQEMIALREDIALQYEKKVMIRERTFAGDLFQFRSMIYKRVIVVIWNKLIIIVLI